MSINPGTIAQRCRAGRFWSRSGLPDRPGVSEVADVDEVHRVASDVGDDRSLKDGKTRAAAMSHRRVPDPTALFGAELCPERLAGGIQIGIKAGTRLACVVVEQRDVLGVDVGEEQPVGDRRSRADRFARA